MFQSRAGLKLKVFITLSVLLTLLKTTFLVQGEINYQGLSAGDGIRLVLDNCTVCHSADIILQNHMSRKNWNKTITLMQQKRGMAKLKKQDQKIILDYLSKYQGIDGDSISSKAVRKKNNPMYDFDYRPNPL